MALGMVDHCLLIETETGLVLVDTGYGTACVRDPGRMVGPARFALGAALAEHETAVHRVRALGLDPADVRDIVLTHLDLDHAGGLSDFPDARVHVHGPELRAAEKSRNPRYRPAQWAHGPKWEINEANGGDEWFGFRAVRELPGLPPEILVVPLYGHTAGHVGVAVDTGQGWLLHAGDSYYVGSEVDPVRPHTPLIFTVLEAQSLLSQVFRDNKRRLSELNREHGGEVTVFSSHDTKAFERLSG
ncbi:metallo-beta-lactamase superfamily protein [Nocardia puris]|uniref:Metallo-beta-lactamase superfamily protein n=2 Tax=Nocardia puris TaxID=208602 RepID=A0A366E2X9_9NOCA|nr:metallo-beta-lactamase superfamily protein [Nocardia puris]